MIDFLVSAPSLATVLFVEAAVMMCISAWFVRLMARSHGHARWTAALSALLFAAIVPASFYGVKWFVENPQHNPPTTGVLRR